MVGELTGLRAVYHYPPMDLSRAYQKHCLEHQLEEDAYQVQIVNELQAFAAGIDRNKHAADINRGLYLWGPVGRGKTMLMDLFFESLDTPGKRRIHFHQLMRWVRDRLAQLSGRANPMAAVAAELVPPGSVICIDELHVSDVDNALVVEVLLKELVSSRTVVVTTSNFSPDEVIDDELGREFGKNNPDSPLDGSSLFQTSKRETQRLFDEAFRVTRLGGTTDYRTSIDSTSSALLDSRSEDTALRLQSTFERLTGSAQRLTGLSVFGRAVNCKVRTADALWFEYHQICEHPYSYRDYLELLAGVHTVILEDVEILTLDGSKRFGWLIEVIYDAGIQLIMTAAGGLEGLYQNIETPRHLVLEQQRVLSRVRELTR